MPRFCDRPQSVAERTSRHEWRICGPSCGLLARAAPFDERAREESPVASDHFRESNDGSLTHDRLESVDSWSLDRSVAPAMRCAQVRHVVASAVGDADDVVDHRSTVVVQACVLGCR